MNGVVSCPRAPFSVSYALPAHDVAGGPEAPDVSRRVGARLRLDRGGESLSETSDSGFGARDQGVAYPFKEHPPGHVPVGVASEGDGPKHGQQGVRDAAQDEDDEHAVGVVAYPRAVIFEKALIEDLVRGLHAPMGLGEPQPLVSAESLCGKTGAEISRELVLHLAVDEGL